MRLVCWNLAGKVARLADQAARVVAAEPGLVCLQEVRARTAPDWASRLADAGLSHAVVSQPVAVADGERPRPLLTLIAARLPLTRVEVADVPWPERVVAARCVGLEIVNVHSPISTKPGLVKVLTHEAVHAHLAAGQGPRLVCGDLNTPRREHSDGTVWTFARDRYGRLDPARGERWDRAELALIRGLEECGLRDAFRALHGYERREVSWEWPRWGGGYRLDHLIVSAQVSVTICEYRHEWRADGLSDHSPLVAELRWPGAHSA